ncbi:MAG: single-stranded-DNA-specific exonuclease RecJ [Thermodesulfobacterium sp.]|nr:single-stranded-DNA-specific exonuclease RecJ [Caldimicrobium sp.]MDW8136103.1 single-stranded-DNA-specific exonuclease RecJ [Thermodesulfobacterium sp.]
MSFKGVWLYKTPSQELFYEFLKEGAFSPLLAAILVNKGFTNPRSAYSFIYPQLSDFSDPFEFPEMERALKRIEKAFLKKEKIALYGDSDTDGIIGVFILYDFLKNFTPHLEIFISNKEKEGYGFHTHYLPIFKEKGISLVITVDVGISAHTTIKEAQALGIDVIVTDHHEVSSKPETITIGSKRLSSSSPLYFLCGTGVAFTLIRALRSYLYQRGFLKDTKILSIRKYLELVTLATLADVVPLQGENRVITFFGFRDLSEPSFPATKVMLKANHLEPPLSEEDLYYKIIPQLNAAGRLGYPELVFNFLKSETEEEAYQHFSKIEKLNLERQEREGELLKSIEENFLNCAIIKDYFILLKLKEVSKGFLGLIANRLKNLYQKPAVVVSVENGLGVASVRTPKEIDFFEILSNCKDLLIEFGGHKHALGFKIIEEKLPFLAKRIEKLLLEKGLIKPSLGFYVEAITTIPEILNPEVKMVLEQFPPYGEGHQPPLVLLKNFEVKEIKILKDKHSKLTLKDKDKEICGIFFNHLLENFQPKMLIGNPFVNFYSQSVEIKIKDVK